MPTISSTFQTSKPCDVDYLVQLLAGDRIAAQNLARIFLDVYPGKIDLVDAALNGNDWGALRRVVHELRGSCALFSATACINFASKLKEVLPDHVDASVPENCARFKDALAEVVAELNCFLARG